MKGKEAAAAAARRAREIESERNALRQQLAEERAAHRAEVTELRTQITDLGNALRSEVAEMAEDAITRIRIGADAAAALHETRIDLMAQYQNRIILNVCHLMSIAWGLRPDAGIASVVSWALGRRVGPDEDLSPLLDELGIRRDDWTSVMVRKVWAPEVSSRPGHLHLEGLSPVHPDHDADMFAAGDSRATRRFRSTLKIGQGKLAQVSAADRASVGTGQKAEGQ